jgi:DNA-binding beta-propeller fold protein YncE
VAAVLGDAIHRVSVLGGREGMARSLGSALGGLVTRFLGGGLRGVVSRVIDTPGVQSICNGVAVSRDGSTLLVSDYHGGSNAIHAFSVTDGSLLRVVGGAGFGPLQFREMRQLWIADDDFVFVADHGNHRVQVLTPALDFHGFVGAGLLHNPAGVCANADIVVVSESVHDRVSVFSRDDGTLLRRFGSAGDGDGQLTRPCTLCFMSGGCHVAVADYVNCRVSVFATDGAFIRHVGAGKLSFPSGVACSGVDDLVIVDCLNKRVVASTGGKAVETVFAGGFTPTGVALSGHTVFVQDMNQRCVLVE